MKTILRFLCLIFICFIFCETTNGQSHLRWYPVRAGSADKTLAIREAVKDSTIYLGPSVSFDVFIKEKSTGQYKIGAIPGVGYGIKYNPFKWKKNYLIGIDLFAQADISEEIDNHSGFDYFNIDLLPVVTFFNWIGIGYGPRFKIGLDAVPNTHTTLFSIGIRKAL